MIYWGRYYDHPTDTFLPSMMMDDNLKLNSWKRVNDPAKGNFTFKKYQSTETNYISWKRSEMYWRSGSGIFDSSDQKLLHKIDLLLSNSSNGENITYNGKNFTISPVLKDNITRLVMRFSGELQLFNWDNGQCENSGLKYCKCLPGFVPNSPNEWNSGEFSSGCTRKTTTCLTDKKKYTFLKLKIMTVEDPGSLPEAISEEDCENECVGHCNCQAYSYIASSVDAQRVTSTNSSRCRIWTENLRNLHEDTEGAYNLSVRVARTDIESTSRDCEPCGANILPYPLCTGQNCGDPMYNNFHCNKSTGQVEFQEPSGIYRVTSINPDNLTFIIQLTDTVKNADICCSKNFRVSPSVPYKVIGSSCNASLAVEISWDPTPQPTCTLLEDCTDWPNSSCNTTEDGKRRCLCNANYHWHGLELNCTSVLEYALDGLFSIKSDAFSFGVIVLEIVSGKRNTGFYKSQQAFNLLGHREPSDPRSMPNVVFMLGSETTTLPNPKPPAFLAKNWLSDAPSSSSSSSKPETFSNNALTVEGDEIYLGCSVPESSNKIRGMLTPSGQAQVLLWEQSDNSWVVAWKLPVVESKCDFYGQCAPFSSCEQNGSHPFCSCLQDFEPKDQNSSNLGNWTGGCARKMALTCDLGDWFFKFERTKLPDYSISLGNMTVSQCESKCRDNCSCTAYAYANMSRETTVHCMNWFGDFVDLKGNDYHGKDLYVRLHGSGLVADCKLKHRSRSLIAIAAAAISAGLLLISSFGYVLRMRRLRSQETIDGDSHELDANSSASVAGPSNGELLSFSLRSILAATDNFSEVKQLGEGGYGPVYKGNLPVVQEVAIKKLSKKSLQGTEEFMNELKLIAKLQHQNLVRLWGCCVEQEEKILIYEYMCNGSLDKLLFCPSEQANLDWSKQFRIIEGIAQRLIYLHNDRPTMYNAILMMSNENASVPSPKEPAFSTCRSSNSVSYPPQTSSSYSNNEVTITMPDAR
ncbi:hypothetical protein TEA_029908 [Camellia sinensis var. sinensis]|uniref:Protein kinase domain-containing protein n=1 Tax=Camellia sinensis var. sinensis TaxID=542762 RepID=A0A4S4EHI2_CAMSN|nr:hypothetical protein TEA_029908 [Camellia sinensis var. sinensis]